jgi:hypothetical protein
MCSILPNSQLAHEHVSNIDIVGLLNHILFMVAWEGLGFNGGFVCLNLKTHQKNSYECEFIEIDGLVLVNMGNVLSRT